MWLCLVRHCCFVTIVNIVVMCVLQSCFSVSVLANFLLCISMQNAILLRKICLSVRLSNADIV